MNITKKIIVPVLLFASQVINSQSTKVDIKNTSDDANNIMRNSTFQTLYTVFYWILSAGVVFMFLLSLFKVIAKRMKTDDNEQADDDSMPKLWNKLGIIFILVIIWFASTELINWVIKI